MKKIPKYSHLPFNRKLLEDESFIFECHPGMDCFTRCCRDADMYLYPYDIIRLKSRLALSSEQFLEQHTTIAFRDNPYFPSVMLQMSDREDKACPFLSSAGCGVYEDRPFSCRAYPLERAVARVADEKRPKEMYFLVRHSHCDGHQEIRRWTVAQWLDDQKIKDYNEINDRWVEIDTLFRQNPWKAEKLESPKLKMAFMACFNIDRLRTFITQSSFFARFEVEPGKIDRLMASDTDLLKFGFDWIEFSLTGKGLLKIKAQKKSPKKRVSS